MEDLQSHVWDGQTYIMSCAQMTRSRCEAWKVPRGGNTRARQMENVAHPQRRSAEANAMNDMIDTVDIMGDRDREG